ncbi:hypothetical protein [Hymenobacter siberiensis]|uniref:hypothetical protein n=1 Tax=Hymenobacter siberiensis TaxID=2848396 RepID=UPI001C1E726E|nr:hypothetical protein [Hymenobacter siberiensis]
MAYTNYLQNGYENSPTLFIPGAKTLMLIKADAVQQLVLATKDEVDDVVRRSGENWNLFNNLDNLSYILTPEATRNGTLYTAEISFTVPIQTTQKNRLFEAMRNTDLVAIVEDKNFRWWLIGVDQPLRMVQQEQKLDNDTNQYAIKLACRQRDNVKQMTPAFVSGLTAAMFNTSIDAVDGVTLDIRVATSTSGTTTPITLPNNFQNTVTAPPNNYVILDSIGLVFATPATTVKLPAVALNGQQHTVKDYNGLASTASITVSGNGKLIDGYASFSISTDFGAATFTYNNGAWLVSSFVN